MKIELRRTPRTSGEMAVVLAKAFMVPGLPITLFVCGDLSGPGAVVVGLAILLFGDPDED